MVASSASPLTPLDYIAAGYWQDFLANRPIAGGIAYEAELRDCTLDESLASLQRIDTLLSKIRRDMIKSNQWQEEARLIDERYRNFMVFLAFYAGRVLAQQWQDRPHWFGQFELRQRYAELPLASDDFYQHMAVVYRDDSETTDINTSINTNINSLFFALEPIGLRLFGHIDRPFKAVQSGEVASGLYQAVSERLPHSNDSQVADTVIAATPTTAFPSATQHTTINTDASSGISNNAGININNDAHLTTAKVENSLSKQQHQNKPELSKSELSKVKPQLERIKTIENSNPVSVTSTPPKQPAPVAKISPTPEIFTQLLLELDSIEVAQRAGSTDYQQAHKVLKQFEQHIAKQNKPRAQILFSESHLAAKKQALLKLQEAANAGHTAAMLSLAMYELLDEGLAVDKSSATESAIEWVKQAASEEDSRGQRLLSKMYYQGIGVAQDIANGKYWLEQAAKNGHAEAASVVSQWQQAQVLMTTQKEEQHSIKRYQLLFAAILVVAVLIFIIV